ncbi:hypothetical protein [Myxococcus eversor]|uniref:hypothetical protein n=1 Tax=Myxococcus eversor TaxID=2709661 RepID=UPI0013D2316A|nr:hypothetical protein [Myxococcus eversor]
MSKLRHTVFVALAIPVVLSGCGPEDLSAELSQEEAAKQVTAAPELDTQPQALVPSSEYTWSQGHVANPMGITSGRSCFLTRVGGDFEGSGERVDIFQTGGSWYLGGNSSQTSINGAARCVSASGDTTEYQWTQSMNYPVNMGTATNRMCYLVGVAGKFNGGGEWVHAYVSGGQWYLSGDSGQSGVRARARCITVSPTTGYTPEISWSQGQGSAYMGPSSGLACALTYVKGKFEGGGEYVRIFDSGGYWYLGGGSNQVSVAAKARCF